MCKTEYMPVECLQVPKKLFRSEKYKKLSNAAKLLYSLLLDRLRFAAHNGWLDKDGQLFVIYPKSEIKRDLNVTRYGADQAIAELTDMVNLVRIVPESGKANHFYIRDITENEMEEETMMSVLELMQSMTDEDRAMIMSHVAKASMEILEELSNLGYLEGAIPECIRAETDFAKDDPESLDEDEDFNEEEVFDFGSLSPMEIRGYYDEDGDLDLDAIAADADDFGMGLGLAILAGCESFPEHIEIISDFVNEQYHCCSPKKFMKVIETLAVLNGVEEVYVDDMYACMENKKARKYYLKELMAGFNFTIKDCGQGLAGIKKEIEK